MANDPRCPGSDDPPTAVLNVDLVVLEASLESLKDTQGRPVWKKTPETQSSLREIFDSQTPITKLEQFFQLLYLIQKNLDDALLPVVVNPPGITDVLLAAKVFVDPSFPRQITSVVLKKEDAKRPPLYRVEFARPEVRFPINNGKGFATWDQGMCQIAKELVFYPGFSFRLRQARNSKNLMVDSFERVEIFGTFGSRKFFSIDLSYVDLEKVEFIRGTDEGRVTARVSQREFKENHHSRFFRFVGTLIPNTARQRIDW